MGLDFALYKKRKDMSIDKLWDLAESMHYSDFEKAYELAYGRKAWELVHMLANQDEIDQGYGILNKLKWDRLMLVMKPIGEKLNRIHEAFCHETFVDNVPYPELFFTDDDKKLINEYVLWWRSTFPDSQPTLGFDFSTGYMISFWNAQDEVNHYLEDPEYDVYMDISY